MRSSNLVESNAMQVDQVKASFGRAAMSASLMLVLSAFNCTGKEQNGEEADGKAKVGKLLLGVELADHSEVKAVRYDITRDGETLREGRMDVRDDGTASTTAADLKAGDGYRVDLTAARSRKFLEQPCRAVASFEVKAGVTTPVPIKFQCEPTGPADELD